MDCAKVARDIDRIGKLARMARPSNNAAEAERERATVEIEALAAAIGKVVSAAGRSAPPPPPPPRQGEPSGPSARLADEWISLMGGSLPIDFHQTIRRFTGKLSEDDIMDAMDITYRRGKDGYVEPVARWRYFCGVCWRKIRDGAAA
jgi:hypothetical protein